MTSHPELAQEKAVQCAYRLLAARPVSEKEFRVKLRGKGYSSDAVEAVTARFKDVGYLNDAVYARQQARTLAINRLWGNYRIERALKEKGVAGNIIAEAIAQAREEVTERAAVMELIRKKSKGRAMTPKDIKEKRRLVQSLMGKGFPPGLIFEILSINGEEAVHDGE